MRSGKWFHVSVVFLVLVYLFVPLLATFLYSIATDWYRTILPEGFTLAWYRDLLLDPRFVDAAGRTIFVCTAAILISVAVMVPTIFLVTVYFPKWERLLQALTMLPYAVPGVVAAVALIRMYSDGPLVLAGTVWLLIGAYFVSILPFMYQGIRNSLRTIDAIRLTDAAELLGASKWQAFRLVVLPNILPGVIVSILLSFSMLFGEFVLANLLIGGHYELLQVYLMRRMSESGHLSSAIVVAYFVLILIMSGMVLKFSRSAKGAKL
ncbi:ABC transporter permease [Effusibacillus pohliae]|uniref:ABC transporter permease n=1 Tax=Effusibacillus pohliae TaxID=232270 RepID=UPI0003672927|nr:ABC transporter permease subunit [Effusibacillus pohliae]